jgi:hypothetical protein
MSVILQFNNLTAKVPLLDLYAISPESRAIKQVQLDGSSKF